MNSKPFWQSKTLWANVLMIVAAIVEGTYGTVGIPANVQVYVALAINVALRFLTNQAIGK
jgi:hypothetical protein